MTSRSLHPRLRTVGELFDESGTVYTVPVYQRNFAWQAEQIEQLISDIKDALAADDDGYFLGNVVVTERPSASNDFEVIDGQQRLTTLHLLLTALSDAGEAPSDLHVNRLRYESRPRATEALRRIAAAPTLANPTSDSGSDEDSGILEGINIIRQYLDQNVTVGAERNRFANYLRGRVTVVLASLPQDIDLNRYFEIMNTRGQQLLQVDIVKARLMSTLSSETERACFAWVWNACSDMDSYVQMALTRGSTAKRTQIFGADWTWFTLNSFDDLIDAQGSKEDGETSGVSFPVSASRTVNAALAEYAGTSTTTQTEDPDNVRFRSPIEFPSFLLHALKVFERDEVEQEGHLDDKRLIARFEKVFGTGSGHRVRDFTVELLRCRNLFDGYILKRQYTAGSDDGDWSLQRLIKRKSGSRPTPGYLNTYFRGKDEIEEDGEIDPTTGDLLLLQSMLRVTYTSPRTMHWITKLLQTLVETDPRVATEQQLSEVLRAYARSKLVEDFFTGEEPTGFRISRIVFTYLDYLLLEEEPNPAFRFAFRNSIEHFYPQHPDAQQTGNQVSDKHLDLLGNLALVSVGANSKFSNSLPKAKAENYSETIEIQSPKLQAMATITRADRWSDTEVHAHHSAMVTLLRNDISGPDSGQTWHT